MSEESVDAPTGDATADGVARDGTADEEGRSLWSITQGASLFFVGKGLSSVLGFVFNLILTRVLGAALYGIYAYGETILRIFIILGRLGTGKSLLRFVPATSDDPARRNWVIGLAYLTALAGSIVIGAGVFALAPTISAYTLDEPLLVDVLRILALVLPFNTLTNLTNAVFRALEKLEYQVVVAYIVKPVVRILAVAVAFLLGYALIGAVAALAVGGILIFSVAITVLYTRTDVRPTGKRSPGSLYEFYNYSLPLTLKDVGEKLYTRVDILMVGLFLTGSAVGIYRVSILLAAFLALPLSGINQLFPPVASGLYSDGNMEELESVYRIVTRWIFTLVLPAALALVVYSSEVLAIFGEEFAGGAVVLVLFALAQLTNCAVGPSGYLLMMTDHQYVNLANQWVLGVLNVVLNYVLILRFGFVGAAVATASTLAFINVVRVAEVWHLERMTPYSTKFWKPTVAGACGVLVMAGWRFVLDGYPLLVVGSVTGGLAFLGVLFAVGIEQEDLEFYAENVAPRIE